MLPLVLLVLLAVVEVAVVARTQLELVNAAREGARQAATHTDPSLAVGAVQAALGDGLAARTRVAVTRPPAVGEAAEVRLTLSHAVATPVFGGFTVDLTARASMRVER